MTFPRRRSLHFGAAMPLAYADAAAAPRFAETGGEVPGTPAAFGRLFGGEVARWARLLTLSDVKSE
jgi:hypothetical protein